MHSRNTNNIGSLGAVGAPYVVPDVLHNGGVEATSEYGPVNDNHQMLDGNSFHALQALALNCARSLRESALTSIFPPRHTPIGLFPITSPLVNCDMGVDQVNHMSAVQMAEYILKEYRTLDCSCCNQFFGYMHRQTGAIFCSSTCLGSSPGPKTSSHTVPLGRPVPPPPTPLTPQQVLALTNHVGHSDCNGLVVPPSQDQVPTEEIETRQPRNSTSSAPKRNQIANADVEFTRKSVADVVKSTRETGNEAKKDPIKKTEDADVVDNRPAGFVAKEIRKITRVYANDEKLPFSKGEDSAATNKPSEQRKVNRGKEESTQAVRKEGNPFMKEIPPSKPVPETTKTNKEVVTPKSSGSNDTNGAVPKERNPFIKTTPTPVKVKEVAVDPNPLTVRLRSALAFSSDPDEFMERPILGGKCSDNGPVDFYFQSTAMNKKVAALQVDINNFAATAKTIPVHKLEVGQLVFAPFGEELFRGEIIGIPKPDVAEIFYVDYGNTMTLPKKDLSQLPKEFFDVPRLCFHCQWDFWLAKDPGEELSETDASRYHSTETKGVTPLLKIGDGQYVVAIGSKAENVKFAAKPYEKLEKVLMKNPVERPLPPFKSAIPKKKFIFKDCKYSDLLQDGKDIKIGYAWDCTKYLIISPDDELNIVNLQNIVNEGIESAKVLKIRPDIGEVILAPYQGEFYRAKVMAHEGQDKVKAMFFDFGDVASVQFSELREPSDTMMKHPIYAMDIVLDGVPDIKGNLTLDQEANELLANTLQLQIKKRPLEDGDSDVFSVTLWKGDETLNRVIRRLIAQERKAEEPISKLKLHDRQGHTYLDRLCLNDSYTRSTLENYKRIQTAAVYENSNSVQVPSNWSMYDTQFDYFESNVSLQPFQGIVDFEIVKFRKLDCIVVTPQSNSFEMVREAISEEIEEYIFGANWSEKFKPLIEQVCLVKYPLWTERSEIYIAVHGIAWFSKNNHNLIKTDSIHSGKWHRGIFKGEQNGYYGIDFCDLGKCCLVQKTNVYKSPLRFVVAPALRTTLVILWQEVVQLTKRLGWAMEYVLTPGKRLKTLIVAEHDDITLVRLLEPEEKMLIEQGLRSLQNAEEAYLRRTPRKPTKKIKLQLCPKSLRIPKHREPDIVPENYVVNLGSSDENDDLEDPENDPLRILYNEYKMTRMLQRNI